MSAAPLDFLVIGAPKAGTTSLHEYMRTHPGLQLPEAKEHPFFNRDSAYEQGWERFSALAFRDPPGGRLRGMVSPHYLGGPVSWAEETVRAAPDVPAHQIIASRIAETFPGVKLVAILREPVERAISSYWQAVVLGDETRGLNEALAQELEPAALEAARLRPREDNQYIVVGEYGRLLGGYLDHFPREALFVTSTSELELRPMAPLERLWRFLGVDDGHQPPNLGRRYQARGTGAPREAPDSLAARLMGVPGVRAAWGALPAGLRDRIRARRRVAAYRREQRSRTDPGELREEPTAELRTRLEAHFAPDRERLELLVGPVEAVTTLAPAEDQVPGGGG